jgi:hypothetical protein
MISVFLSPFAGAAQGGATQKKEKTFEVSLLKPLSVWLKVDAGEVEVLKGSKMSTCKVIMDVHEEDVRSEIEFDVDKNRLEIYLDKINWHDMIDNHHGEDHLASVRLELPAGAEIRFDSKIKVGEVVMQMGGLRLQEFSVRQWVGELEIRFDEPNQITMDLLDVDAKIGETRLIRLGNARFNRADINGGIGEIQVDFSGDFVSGSKAKVDLDIGEALIQLPEDAGIRMQVRGGLSFLSEKNIERSLIQKGGSYYSEDYDQKEKKFFLRITPALGELSVR